MKSGVQLNFLERRVRADRALSQLVRMARDATETLSSREQRGVYRLESTLMEKSNTALVAPHVRIGHALAIRWAAFVTVVWMFVRRYSARAFISARRLWIGAALAIRWAAFVTIVLAFVRRHAVRASVDSREGRPQG